MRFILVALVLTACSAPPEEWPDEPGVIRFDGRAASEANVIDLRATDVLYMVDRGASGYAPERITLICPNGVSMTLQDWLDDQMQIYGFDVTETDNDRFFLTGGVVDGHELPTPESAFCEDCRYDCRRCADGALVCTAECEDPEDNTACTVISSPDEYHDPCAFTWPAPHELPEGGVPGSGDPLPDEPQGSGAPPPGSEPVPPSPDGPGITPVEDPETPEVPQAPGGSTDPLPDGDSAEPSAPSTGSSTSVPGSPSTPSSGSGSSSSSSGSSHSSSSGSSHSSTPSGGMSGSW
jgi:hypothetical protein